MYKIEWHKYLSANRVRHSGTLVGQNGDHRSCFDSDLGRIIFCYALRRMHDKTQVVPLSNGDTVLTRLTHSLQVMNIAESLAINYTRDKEFDQLYPGKAIEYASSISAILRAAALIHDIGNPPFGHFGEVTIQKYFHDICTRFPSITPREALDFTEFDGNALGLRLVSKLQYTGTLDGLNLSYATLAAYMKYPNEESRQKNGYVGMHKHGVFTTESRLFGEIIQACNMIRPDGVIKRHPLSFLVEAADTICYDAMDIEDGYNMHLYDLDTLVSFLDNYIITHQHNEEKLKPYLTDPTNPASFSIEKVFGYTRQWPEDIDKNPQRLILDFRVKLISYLTRHAVNVFKDNLQKIDEGTYNKELLRDDDLLVDEALSEFTKRYIISQSRVQQIEMTGNSVINGLLDILIKYAFSDDKQYRSKIKGVVAESRLIAMIHETKFSGNTYSTITRDDLFDFDLDELNAYAKLRLIVDFIANMTDKYSVELYQKLSGIRI